MHVQPISTFRLFREGHHLLRNSIAIFALTTLFYFIAQSYGWFTNFLLAADRRNGGGVCPLCLA